MKLYRGPRAFTSHLVSPSFACESCSEVGEHPCLPELQNALEEHPELLRALWPVWLQYKEEVLEETEEV